MTGPSDAWASAAALRDDWRVRARVTGASAVGALVVAGESILVGLPTTQSQGRFLHDNLVSALVLFGYLVVAVAAANAISRQRAARTFSWIAERRSPTADQVDAAFAYPWVEARDVFGWWLGGAAVFVALNLAFGHGLLWAVRVGLSIMLGGLTSAALSFLLLERFSRPVFALALAGEPDRGCARIGVHQRLLFSWALGAAVPVTLIVTAPLGLSTERRVHLAVPIGVLGVVALAVGLVLTVVASRSIAEPIEALRDAQRRVAQGDLTVDVAVDDGGEVGLLQAGFNRMVTALGERQHIHDLFGRHVGVEVARHALSRQPELGGELREASMLFVDVIGSTPMAQRLGPQQLVNVLNDFFSRVVRSTAAEGGWVNKFEGDAALCVFGPPDDRDDHAARALRAARRLHTELSELGKQHRGFDAGIGVATGTVVAGNIGDTNRYEYTVIGDPVNQAARLAELAKHNPQRLIASCATVDASGVESTHWTHAGSEVLRGRDTRTELFTVTADNPQTPPTSTTTTVPSDGAVAAPSLPTT